MLGSAIVDRCEARFGDSSNQVYSADEWLAYVNDTYMDVVAAADWPFLEGRTTGLTVTAGTGEVSLPTDVFRVTSVYNATDGLPLAPIPGRAEFRRYFPEPENGLGMPLYYRLRSNTLEVYPHASAETSLTVDTVVPPAALATDAEPVFPEQYHRLLVLGALAKAHDDDENPAQADRYQARYERLLADMKTDLLSPRTEAYPEVVDSFY